MDLNFFTSGQTTAGEIRDALIDFKESEKFIIAFAEYYTQGGYYLASVADRVYVHPIGGVEIKGLAREGMFYKDALDKFNIKMQVFWAGQFKSASEPYRRNDMSQESKLQAREYLHALFNNYLERVSESRNMTVRELRNIADQYLVRDAEDAIQYKLADVIGYRDEAISDIRNRIGLDEKDKLNLAKIADYYKASKPSTNYKIKDKIAVVYAEGLIDMGKGSAGSVGDDKYTKIISDIRKKDDIKAIVMRINSPGGSALASENIWRELRLAQEEGKVVVASMGDVAASGGYYLACPADEIFAEPSTITGSIGVVGAIPSLEGLLSQKVGVHIDTVKTGPYAAGISLLRDIPDHEMKIIQESTEEFYQIFLKRVADGRDMPVEEVHKIAQGRVWIGETAKQLGLVDELGGLEEAIAEAAKLSEIDEYRITEYPKIKDPLNQLLDDLKEGNTIPLMKAKEELGEFYPFLKHLKDLQKRKGVQAIYPYYIDFH